jgi:hypothetical protein
MSKLQLELGKTYLTKGGDRMTLERMCGMHFEGVRPDGGIVHYRPDGELWMGSGSCYVIVSEAPPLRPFTAAAQPTVGLGWIVRERRNAEGKLVDCFVEAPRAEGMAHGCEVLGDDYTGYGGVEGKFKHCQMIVAWANGTAGMKEGGNG